MERNIFELATRQHLRFPSVKGQLSVEDLWDLPLTGKNPQVLDLDTVAKTVHAELKASAEESFVTVRANPRQTALELAMEVVKAIIEFKLAARTAANQKEVKRAERERLQKVLETKDEEALKTLSADEVRARLRTLDAELEAQ